MIKKIFMGLVSVTTLTTACVASTNLDKELNDITGTAPTVEGVEKTPTEELVKVEKTWNCPTCSPNEQYVLKKLQEYTKISDRNALATIMGNIKSESNFRANICEGGARVSYTECKSGGFGLIQWTSIGRYKGLGNFCARYQCDPSSLEGQVRWMVNEPIFQRVLPEFEGHGDTIPQYMSHAYYWLGWGIKGYREQYAYDYSKKMVLA
jgi:hypothetical protein